MHELRSLTATEIARAVSAGELDPADVVEAHLEGLPELARLNATIATCPEQALARARAGVRGPLAGVPLLVKDLFDTEGIRTTYGSSIYGDHVPERTAAAVALLEAAGAIVIGKANLHEFAWGTTSQNPFYGTVGNPAHPGRVAGGSSGGNGAALAARVGALGLGTDTAGSVRIPAACCEIVGFRPTHGRVPLEGCFSLSPTYDTAGPMARTVADCALAFSVLADEPVPKPRLAGLRVGVLDRTPSLSPHEPGLAPPPTDADLLATVVEQLGELGASVVQAELPQPDADLVPILFREAAIAHAETFPARREEYGPDTQLKWDMACAVPASAAAAAYDELPRWRERTRETIDVDLLLSPTLAIEVPRDDVWEPDVRVGMVGNTRPFSFLGWPAIAIGGFQLAGLRDSTVLAAALAWEQAFGST